MAEYMARQRKNVGRSAGIQGGNDAGSSLSADLPPAAVSNGQCDNDSRNSQVSADDRDQSAVTPEPLAVPLAFLGRMWAKFERLVFQFNVTFGLYMLDWWERAICYVVALLLLWFLLTMSCRFLVSSYFRLTSPLYVNGEGHLLNGAGHQ